MVPYADESLFEEFKTVNKHIVVQNKIRLEEILQREGSIDNCLKYIEERAKKEQLFRKMVMEQDRRKKSKRYRKQESTKKSEVVRVIEGMTEGGIRKT